MPPDSTAPAALTAFLRGVERRGLAFAWLLAGSRKAGAEALAWAVERFRREAGKSSFGDWPRRFWSLLLGAPTLRRPPADSRWEAAFAPLAGIGHGPRAALLLRLVAGLAESDAAAVLGTTRATYRLGLARALPHRADGSADVEAWRSLGQAAQDLQRALAQGAPCPGPGAADDTGPQPPASGRRPTGRGLRAALWLVALLTLLALGATFLGASGPGSRLPEGLAEAPNGILAEPLPPSGGPAGRYPADAALELHPDLALLLDVDGQSAAAADPAFHAWLLADAAAAEGGPAVPVGARPAASEDPGAATSAADPNSEAAASDARARLGALAPTGREALDARRRAWDALPPAERGELRERWLAWAFLPEAERRALVAAAERHAQRPPEEREALRARFDALDASVRRGWLLGPDLGADYARLHPLIAQVPADARTALLDALRTLDPQARDDLAVLAVRTPPEARAGLRVELLATPPAQRGRWLRNKVSPPP